VVFESLKYSLIFHPAVKRMELRAEFTAVMIGSRINRGDEKSMIKWIKRTVYTLMILTGILAGTGLLLMDSTLRHTMNPVMISEAPPLPEDLNGIQMQIRIGQDDGFVDGLFIDVPESEFVVLFCHDLDGNIYDRLEMIRRLKDLGVSVLALDYRGFGISDPVEISDETFHTDLKKAYEALRRRRFSASRIIVYGQGLSAGIQGELIKENQCAAWIMDNPILSLQDTTDHPIRRFLTVGRLSAYEALTTFHGPVMVCYDPEETTSDTIETLQKIRPENITCPSPGQRTRDRMNTVDWQPWTDCMTGILKQLEPPDVPTPRIMKQPMEKTHE